MSTKLVLGLFILASCADDPEIRDAIQRIDGFLAADGAISSTSDQAQDWPAVAVRLDGTALVVFHDRSPFSVDSTDEGDIRGRFVALDGTPIGGGDFLINTTTARTQDRPDVAVSADGTFLVVWQDTSLAPPDTTVSAIRARRLELAAGAPSFLDLADFVVPAKRATGQTAPAVDAAPDGSFVVVWQDKVHTVDPAGWGVRLRRVGADGLPAGTDRQVNSTTAGHQTEPAIAIAPDGSYVVAFTDASGSDDTSATGIRARRFGADDVALGADLPVNATTEGAQKEPDIAVDSDGAFLVAWNDGSTGAGDPAPTGIRARRLTSAGSPSGVDMQINSTTTGAQSLPAVAFDAGNGSYVIAWTDASLASPDTAISAVRARRLLADDNFSGPDAVVNTTVAGAQTQPALPPRALTGLLFAWASPDGSSRGVRGRAMLVGCPPNGGTDFFADPVADRTGMPSPTGVRSPAVCAFPTMTAALSFAAAAAATPGVSARAVASNDTAGPGVPVTFAAETFPWLVPGRVVVTTTDDPALGGGGLDPAGFEVVVDDHGGGPASVRLLGAASRTTAGGALRGFSLSQSCAGCPSIAIKVEGFGAPSTPRLESIQVDGGTTWSTGVEVRGNGLLDDLRVAGIGSLAGAGQGLHIVNDAGANALDKITVSGGQFTGNNIGILVSGGQVELDGPVVGGSLLAGDGSGGDGLVIRDWRLGGPNGLVITPTTLTVTGVTSDGNDDDGVLVDMMDAASTAALDACTVTGNQGDGIDVRGAPHADAPLDGIAGLTEYGLVVSACEISGNLGDGVTLGSESQEHAIAARIGGSGGGNLIALNAGAGLTIRQSAAVGPCPNDGVTACTGATIMNNLIHDNGESGIELDTALILPRGGLFENGLGFVSNLVAHNAMASAGCLVAQTAPQIHVVGPVAIDPTFCAGQVTQEACEAESTGDSNNHCVWNASVCTVAWDLRGNTDFFCSTDRSSIFGYNIADFGNVLSVGLRAINGAKVDVSHNEWQSSQSSDNVSDDGNGSFVRNLMTCNSLSCGG